jgi:hypothetical protein
VNRYSQWVSFQYAHNLRDLLGAVEPLDDDRLRWGPPRANSIAFHLWHVARWADYLQSVLSEMTPALRSKGPARTELWASDGIAARWKFAIADLGRYETGTLMSDANATGLTFPPKSELLDYAGRSFRLAQEAVAALTDDDLLQPAEVAPGREPWFAVPKEPNLVIRFLVLSLGHDARHLGMIEALKGLQGHSGTAST